MAEETPQKPRTNAGWANLKPIQPGEVRNPGGRTPKDIRALRDYNNRDVERQLNDMVVMTTNELSAFLNDAKTTSLQKMLGVILYKAIANGDVVRAHFILERLGCRLPPMVQPVAMQVKTLTEMTNKDLVELGKQAMAIIEAQAAVSQAEEMLANED